MYVVKYRLCTRCVLDTSPNETKGRREFVVAESVQRERSKREKKERKEEAHRQLRTARFSYRGNKSGETKARQLAVNIVHLVLDNPRLNGGPVRSTLSGS